MVSRGALVHIDLAGETVPVGRLIALGSRGGERVAFAYDDSWLARPERFALEPALSPGEGIHYPEAGRSLFGVFSDSAPDRWGRMLLQRSERLTAQREKRAPRTLSELDYLLGVRDETRLGALRFTALEGGPFLAQGLSAAPPLVEIRRLLGAALRFQNERETDADVELLLAPGSSLGGARPKAAVRDTDGSLLVAKFPGAGDAWPVVQWEWVALQLAHAAGITVPFHRLERVGEQMVLLLRRFDRAGALRVPFLSMLTLLGARDGESAVHSWPEMAEALRRHGARPTADREELWRRLVFGVMIRNTDDHLRNHGVLHGGSDGWVLAPIYDVNPVPADAGPALLATAVTLEGDHTASVELTLDVAEWFGLKPARARAILGEVRAATALWRRVARRAGLNREQCDRMGSAFT